MVRTNHGEVTSIKGRELGHPQPLGDRDEAGIHAAESKVGVAFDKFGDSAPVGDREIFDREVAVLDGAVESRLGPGAQLGGR